jgi:phosphopentomutase
MKQLIFITIFFVSLSVKSQTAVKDQIIGNWKVENVIVKSTNKEMVELSQAFRNSIFSFTKNQDFNFTPKQKKKLTAMLTEMLQNQKWIFDEKKKSIRIGKANDHYTIMGITAKIENNKAYFKLEESELNLQLVKI